MIAKVTRGWRVAGLVWYLMGPGRFNEHTEQRVVASWDGAPGAHQPPVDAVGRLDVTGLATALADPAVAAGVALSKPAQGPDGKVARGPVWHCSLRNAAGDRVLSDEEWEQVVTELMDRTGIARRGDAGGCRWVAVRHAPDHVHIAAVLVRQDNGRRVHPRQDFVRAREVCREAEERLGLTSTAPIDRTAERPPSRAESEKAARRGLDEEPRVWLRRAVRQAAVAAGDVEGFFRRLADHGVLVRPKQDPEGGVVGYAVAAPDDVTGDGLPVWFSGRELAVDLSLPGLRARWEQTAAARVPAERAAGERSQVGVHERGEAVVDATSTVEHATAHLAAGENLTPGEHDEIAHAAADVVTAAAAVTQQPQRGAGGGSVVAVPWAAVEVYGRAARAPRVGQPRGRSEVAADLRRSATRLIAVRSLAGRGGSDLAVTHLVVAVAALLAEVAAYREQQDQQHAAVAARHSSHLVRAAAGGVGARGGGGPRPEGPGVGRGPGRDGDAPAGPRRASAGRGPRPGEQQRRAR